jgi:hypothetical protein
MPVSLKTLSKTARLSSLLEELLKILLAELK